MIHVASSQTPLRVGSGPVDPMWNVEMAWLCMTLVGEINHLRCAIILASSLAMSVYIFFFLKKRKKLILGVSVYWHI